jgi:hypothetical protein
MVARLIATGGQVSGGSAGTTVFLVVKAMAALAQHHEIARQLGTTALVRAVVDLKVLSVRDVERAAVACPQKSRCTGPTPLGRAQVLPVRHRAKFDQAIRPGFRFNRQRHGLECGARQPPYRSAWVVDEPVPLEVRQGPRQLVGNHAVVARSRSLRWSGGQLAWSESAVSERSLEQRLAGRFPTERVERR